MEGEWQRKYAEAQDSRGFSHLGRGPTNKISQLPNIALLLITGQHHLRTFVKRFLYIGNLEFADGRASHAVPRKRDQGAL